MRVLILSAFLAYAAAAPSGFVLVGVVPTVPPGDVQAAFIDAQVKYNDQVQLVADQARTISEIAAENVNEGVAVSNDLAKERAEEAVWAAEEKKWQDINEAQIAQAKLEASVASQVEPEALGSSAPVETEPEVKSVAVEAETPVKSEEKPEAVESAPVAEPEAAVKSVVVEATEEKKVETEVTETAEKVVPEARELTVAKTDDIVSLFPSPIGLRSDYPGVVGPLAYAQPVWGTYPVTPIQYFRTPIFTHF